MSTLCPTFVVIPFRGLEEMTFEVVQRLVPQDDYHAIWLFDNASYGHDKTYPWKDIPRVRTMGAPDVNLHRMFNIGMDLARRQCRKDGVPQWNVALLNNDIDIITPFFLRTLSYALRLDHQCAAVSGTERRSPGPNLPTYISHAEEGFQGNAMMLKGELPYRYDEQYEWWFGDTDLLAQYETDGLHVCVCDEAKFVHRDGGSVTTKLYAEEIDYWAGTERDTERFYAKWSQITPPSRRLPD